MPYSDRIKQLSAQREAYRNDSDKYKERQNRRRRRAHAYVWAIKKRSKCIKCGQDHPITLDFHHRNPAEKEVTATQMIANKYSNNRIDIELLKCDILCSNCHRIEHYNLGLLDA